MHQGKQNLKRKHREIKEQIEYIVDEKPWTWLYRRNQKRETESFIIAAKNKCIKRREPK